MNVDPWNPTINTPGALGGTGGTSLEPSSSSTTYTAAETDDTTLQAAINSAASGSCVEVEMGASGQNALVEKPWKPVNSGGSGVTVVIDAGVDILASRNPADYGGGSCGTISSAGDTSCADHWIEPSGASGIGIMGYGVLDARCWDRSWSGSANGAATSGFCYNRVKTYCNNHGNVWAGLTCTGSTNNGYVAYGPDMIHFKGSSNTVFYKITLKDCDNFCIYWGEASSGFTAWGIKIFAPGEVSNTDGFDPSYAATNVSLVDSFISNGDNHVAIKSDSGSSYTGGETKNISILNLQTAAGIGVTIGYDTSGNVSNVLTNGLIQNGNQAVNPSQQYGHGIITKNTQGGTVSQITYENTCVTNETESLVYLAQSGNYSGITESNTTILNGSASGNSGEFLFQGNSTDNLGLTLTNVIANGGTTEDDSDANITLGPYANSSAVDTYLGSVSGQYGITVANSITGSTTTYPCTTSTWQPLIGELSLSTTTNHNAQSFSGTAPAAYTLQAYLHPAMDESTKESPAPTAQIQFYDNGTAIGSPVSLTSDGTLATLALTGVAAGSHAYTAKYNVNGADSNYPTGFTFGNPGTSNELVSTIAAGGASGSISGEVTNISNGGALSGATVSYSGGSATTNSSGDYTLSNVPNGTYQVTAAASGYLSRVFSATVSGGVASLNFPLATAGIMAGTVTDSHGAALPGAQVYLSGGIIATTMTLTASASGGYNSSWIPVGSYTVAASLLNYSSQTQSGSITAGVTTTLDFSLTADTITAGSLAAASSSGVSASWDSTFSTGTLYFAELSTGALPNAFAGNESSNTFNTFATWAALSANTVYYGQVSTASSGPYAALNSAVTLADQPSPAAVSAVAAASLTANWGANGNPSGTSYLALISTDDFTDTLASSQTLNGFATFSSLSPDTTYSLQVQAINHNNTPTAFITLPSTYTLAVLPGVASPAFSGVAPTSFTVSWSSGTSSAGFDPSGTGYRVQISSMADLLPVFASTQTSSLSAAFTGLSAATTYYAQAAVYSLNAQAWTAYASIGSTQTLAGPGTIAAEPYAAITSSSLTADWDSTFAAGTKYYAVLSTGALPNAFSGNLSSNTFNASATWSGLSPNTTYYGQVSTAAAGPFTSLLSTATLAAAPVSAAVSPVAAAGLTANWGANGNPLGTSYLAQISTNNFVTVLASSLTANTSASFSDLWADATYYLQTQAVNRSGIPTTFTTLPSTDTLAVLPAVSIDTFSSVTPSQLTVLWSSGTQAGGFDMAGTSYLVQISSMADFLPVFASTVTARLSATFAGLSAATFYYVQAAAYSIDAQAWTSFALLGSTETLVSGSGSLAARTYIGVSSAALTARWTSTFGAGTPYYAVLSTGALPNAFSGNLSSNTFNTSATWGALNPNMTYYGQVSTNDATGPFIALSSTATWAAPPVAAAASAVTAAALTANWSANGNPSGTSYLAQISTNNFATVLTSSQTLNAFASFSSLSPDATYYLQAQAVNLDGVSTTFTALPSAYTLAVLPSAASPAFASVSAAQATVFWSSGTAAGFDSAGTAYLVQISSMADFLPVFSSTQTSNLSAAFAGLSAATTYYAQAAAYSLNTQAWTPFAALGSTATLPVQPETVAIVSPANGAVVSGAIVISGTASDSLPILGVAVSIDNGPYSVAVGTANWTFNANTAFLSNSSHTIAAEAYDGAENIAIASVNFYVLNASTYTRVLLSLNPLDLSQAMVAVESTSQLFPSSSPVVMAIGFPSGEQSFAMARYRSGPLVYVDTVPASLFRSVDFFSPSTTTTSVVAGSVFNAVFYSGGMAPSLGGAVTDSSNTTTVVIPPGQLTADAQISITQQLQPPALPSQMFSSLGSAEEILFTSTGSLISATLTMTFHPDLLRQGMTSSDAGIAYYNTAASAWQLMPAPSINSIGNTVTINTTHFSLYEPVALLPSGAPGLNAAVVYPDPAVSPAYPTIRVCPGIVDSLDVTIFNVAGRAVDSSTAFTGPFIPSQGVGAGQNCYEYAWTGSKASGAYFAVIHAKASGTTVKSRLKFAVVK